MGSRKIKEETRIKKRSALGGRYRELVRIEYRPGSTADPQPGKKNRRESRSERALYRVRNVAESQAGDTKFL